MNLTDFEVRRAGHNDEMFGGFLGSHGFRERVNADMSRIVNLMLMRYITYPNAVDCCCLHAREGQFRKGRVFRGY